LVLKLHSLERPPYHLPTLVQPELPPRRRCSALARSRSRSRSRSHPRPRPYPPLASRVPPSCWSCLSETACGGLYVRNKARETMGERKELAAACVIFVQWRLDSYEHSWNLWAPGSELPSHEPSPVASCASARRLSCRAPPPGPLWRPASQPPPSDSPPFRVTWGRPSGMTVGDLGW